VLSGFPQLLEHIPGLLLVACRLGGLVLFSPVLASAAVPVRVRAGLAFLIAAAAYPTLNAKLDLGVPPDLDLLMLAGLVAREAAIGAVIGWLATLPLLIAQYAGQIIGTQLGLGFAEIYDPNTDSSAEVIGQILTWLAIVAFLALGGHVWVFLAVLRTFDYVPLGGFSVDQDLLSLVVGILLSTLELGLRLCLPVLAMVFLESLALGFMSKTTPQINILSLGFPLRILAGITITALGMHVTGTVLMDEVHGILEVIHIWATDGNDILTGAALRG
jgi:flagellar biosynthetic protein FliR